MENEIKVGEYIRTKDGVIDKIVDIRDTYSERKLIAFERSNSLKSDIGLKAMVVKHSSNLIDILECGDYINGHKIVNEIWGEDDNNLYFEIEGGYNKARYIGENEIKEVVTKEQFESMSYKVERKD